MTLASVIIPAWNGAEDLPACLDALQSQTDTPHEILVVDNGSTDGTADLVATRYPTVRLLRHSANLGFGGGCNAGLTAAQGDVLVLLNQDTTVRPGWLAALVAAVADPAVGIAGSKTLYPDGTIQHAGGVVDDRGVTVHLGYRTPDHGQHDLPCDVDYVTGASLALCRRAYAAVGGFDPGFDPAYYEDVDLCYRVRHAGLRVVYTPASVLVHHERSAAGTLDYAGLLLQQRNRLRLIAKHWPQAPLTQAFLPAERGWLEQVEIGGEVLLGAVHEAYLVHLLSLHATATWRTEFLGEPLEAITTWAEVLLELHAAYPLIPARVPASPTPDALLTQLVAHARLQEHIFQSDVPLVGDLISAFRRQWHRVSAEWAVRAVVQQQNYVNATLLAAFNRAFEVEQRLAAYQASQTREIATLAQEIAALRAELDDRNSKSR